MFTPYINSFSTQLAADISFYRDQPESNTCLVGLGFVFTNAVAAIENVAALTFCTCSIPVYPTCPAPLERSVIWLQDSIDTFADYAINTVSS